MFKPIADKDVWSVIPMLLRPRSRGFIKLRSSSPFHHPLIIPNYLTDPHDVKVLVEGNDLILLLYLKVSLKTLNQEIYSHVIGSLYLLQDNSIIRHIFLRIYHTSKSIALLIFKFFNKANLPLYSCQK